jgi:chromosome segregation ATPase
MQPHTIRLPEELLAELRAEADERGVSQAEYIRSILRNRTEYDELRRENERLRDQLAATNARQDDVGDLVEYVEEERRIQQRREERSHAPAWRRAKWWLLGTPKDEPDG